jgi:hypothetical protein
MSRFSLITPGEADSTSSLSEVMKFTYTEDTPALRVLDERWRHHDRELIFKLIYRYCPWMIAYLQAYLIYRYCPCFACQGIGYLHEAN